MSNEELVILAKQGDKVARDALWTQNTGLLYNITRPYLPFCHKNGMTRDDIEQECFFAILLAIEAYDPAKGLKFTSYIKFSVQRILRNMGFVAKKKAPRVVSLNAPVGEDEAAELSDLIGDETACRPFDDIEADLYTQKLHSTLEACMAEQLDARQSDILRRRYYGGETLDQLSDTMGLSIARVRQIQKKALCTLGKDRRIRAYREDIITRHAYISGFGAFKTRQASSVEWATELIEAMLERHKL